MWRQPLPMGSHRSPYSLAVQLFGSSANEAPGQASDDECCMPKLCPGSCTSTTQLVEALYQVSFDGLSGVPSDARPAPMQADRLVPKYHRKCWYGPGIIARRSFASCPGPVVLLVVAQPFSVYVMGPITWVVMSCSPYESLT